MDTRTEIARLIEENQTFLKRMSDGYHSTVFRTGEELADIILASPVVAHIRAEALREAGKWSVARTEAERRYPVLDDEAFTKRGTAKLDQQSAFLEGVHWTVHHHVDAGREEQV